MYRWRVGSPLSSPGGFMPASRDEALDPPQAVKAAPMATGMRAEKMKPDADFMKASLDDVDDERAARQPAAIPRRVVAGIAAGVPG